MQSFNMAAMMNQFVFLNGRFITQKEAKISVFDHGFLYGDGVYETLRTYQGKVWQIDEHFKRLKKSAQWTGLRLPWSQAQMNQWIYKLIRLNGLKEARIRITLTRGTNQFDFVSCKKPTLLILAQELQPEPKSVSKDGVKIITVKLERILPEVKTISLFPFILAKQEIAKKKAYEALFVDSRGYVREGTMANFFLVKKGILMTPKKNILQGTTRRRILKIARKLELKVRLVDIKKRQLYGADEIFITNAPRGIVAVKQVDGKVLKPVPGSLTKLIKDEFIHEISSESQ
jgi:branched-chain amino acid aminotransferase